MENLLKMDKLVNIDMKNINKYQITVYKDFKLHSGIKKE